MAIIFRIAFYFSPFPLGIASPAWLLFFPVLHKFILYPLDCCELPKQFVYELEVSKHESQLLQCFWTRRLLDEFRHQMHVHNTNGH